MPGRAALRRGDQPARGGHQMPGNSTTSRPLLSADEPVERPFREKEKDHAGSAGDDD